MKEQTPWDRMLEFEAELKETQAKAEELHKKVIEARTECYAILNKVSANNLTTNREKEIIFMLQREPTLSNKEIAWRLRVTTRCIKFHFSNLFRKYKVEDRHSLYMVLNSINTITALEEQEAMLSKRDIMYGKEVLEEKNAGAEGRVAMRACANGQRSCASTKADI